MFCLTKCLKLLGGKLLAASHALGMTGSVVQAYMESMEKRRVDVEANLCEAGFSG